MKRAGFAPAVVVETSPANFQAWLKHPEKLSKEIGTAAARALARRFGGDPGAADWRHFGRLSGFTNKKPAYRDPATGLHPFVKLIEDDGGTYTEAHRFLSESNPGSIKRSEGNESERFGEGQNHRMLRPDCGPSTHFAGTPVMAATARGSISRTPSTPSRAESAKSTIAAAIRSRDLFT